jgi:hypothetical protein
MFGALVVIAVLVQFRTTAGAIDHFLALAYYAIFLVGSGYLLVGMWQRRLEPNQLHRPPQQTDLLPASWRRWVFDEDQPPRNSN